MYRCRCTSRSPYLLYIADYHKPRRSVLYYWYHSDILKQDSIMLLTRNSSLQPYHVRCASHLNSARLLLQIRIPPSHSQSMSLPVALQSSWLTLETCDIRPSRILFVRPRSCRVALSFPSMLRVLTCTWPRICICSKMPSTSACRVERSRNWCQVTIRTLKSFNLCPLSIALTKLESR
jgi:hypothetical protein